MCPKNQNSQARHRWSIAQRRKLQREYFEKNISKLQRENVELEERKRDLEKNISKLQKENDELEKGNSVLTTLRSALEKSKKVKETDNSSVLTTLRSVLENHEEPSTRKTREARSEIQFSDSAGKLKGKTCPSLCDSSNCPKRKIKNILRLSHLVIALLLVWIASPVFISFGSNGAVHFNAPWGDVRSQEEKTQSYTAALTVDLTKDKLFPVKGSVSIPRRGEGNPLKYANAAMAVAAYISGIVFLGLVLRGLRKAERRRKLLEDCRFGRLLAASEDQDRRKFNAEFLSEMTRVYFGREDE